MAGWLYLRKSGVCSACTSLTLGKAATLILKLAPDELVRQRSLEESSIGPVKSQSYSSPPGQHILKTGETCLSCLQFPHQL